MHHVWRLAAKRGEGFVAELGEVALVGALGLHAGAVEAVRELLEEGVEDFSLTGLAVG